METTRVTIGRLLAVAEFEADVLDVLDRLEAVSRRSSIAGATFDGAIRRALAAVWEARYEVDAWKEEGR